MRCKSGGPVRNAATAAAEGGAISGAGSGRGTKNGAGITLGAAVGSTGGAGSTSSRGGEGEGIGPISKLRLFPRDGRVSSAPGSGIRSTGAGGGRNGDGEAEEVNSTGCAEVARSCSSTSGEEGEDCAARGNAESAQRLIPRTSPRGRGNFTNRADDEELPLFRQEEEFLQHR